MDDDAIIAKRNQFDYGVIDVGKFLVQKEFACNVV